MDQELAPADERGFRQNHSVYASHLLPARALLAVSKCLAKGAKTHEPWNWLKSDVESNRGRLITHALLSAAGGGEEEHEGDVEELAHAACRALFALELALRRRVVPDRTLNTDNSHRCWSKSSSGAYCTLGEGHGGWHQNECGDRWVP